MQFQFSECMYGTCGRIDNKADFDFDFDFKIPIRGILAYSFQHTMLWDILIVISHTI